MFMPFNGLAMGLYALNSNVVVLSIGKLGICSVSQVAVGIRVFVMCFFFFIMVIVIANGIYDGKGDLIALRILVGGLVMDSCK